MLVKNVSGKKSRFLITLEFQLNKKVYAVVNRITDGKVEVYDMDSSGKGSAIRSTNSLA